MTDLLAAMVQRSKAYADPIATSYASGNRAFLVLITRPGPPSTFNRDTREYEDLPDQIIYVGPARIHPVVGGAVAQLGDEELHFSSAQISIDPQDENNSPDPAVLPRSEDVITVLVTPQSSQTHLAGREFTVDDLTVGGHFSTGIEMTATGVAPTRRGGNG